MLTQTIKFVVAATYTTLSIKVKAFLLFKNANHTMSAYFLRFFLWWFVAGQPFFVHFLI